jgi:hypothetical protein
MSDQKSKLTEQVKLEDKKASGELKDLALDQVSGGGGRKAGGDAPDPNKPF